MSAVERALHSQWTATEHMGVDHRGAKILVSQQLLNRADVVSGLQEVGGKGVAIMSISA